MQLSPHLVQTVLLSLFRHPSVYSPFTSVDRNVVSKNSVAAYGNYEIHGLADRTEWAERESDSRKRVPFVL